MKNLKNLKRKMLTGIAGLTLIAINGCDLYPEPYKYTPPATLPNKNQGLDSFSYGIPSPTTKEMHRGEGSEIVVEVMPNSTYDMYVEGSNDGPSDCISVWLNHEKLGEYWDLPISMGGRGWYEEQYSPTFTFSTGTNNQVRVGFGIEVADSYGASPNRAFFNRVAE